MKLRFILLFVLLLAGRPVWLRGQTYRIDGHTFCAGGGISTGDVFSVNCSLGQSVAGGPLRGGNYSLTSGFWSLSVVQTPGAPLLRIAADGPNRFVVAWPAPAPGFVLQESTDLNTASWMTVTAVPVVVGSENRVVVPKAPGNRCYRLFKP